MKIEDGSEIVGLWSDGSEDAAYILRVPPGAVIPCVIVVEEDK